MQYSTIPQSPSVFGSHCQNDSDCSNNTIFREGHGEWVNCVRKRCVIGYSTPPPPPGVTTGECNQTTGTCVVQAWCPVEREDKNTTLVLPVEHLCCSGITHPPPHFSHPLLTLLTPHPSLYSPLSPPHSSHSCHLSHPSHSPHPSHPLTLLTPLTPSLSSLCHPS